MGETLKCLRAEEGVWLLVAATAACGEQEVLLGLPLSKI